LNSVVLLCRHGNTFNAGERVYTVGSKEDLPLTPEGEAQAVALGAAVAAAGVRPTRVMCGPLTRTKRYANLLIEQCKISAPLDVDGRLTELDYGVWSGKTSAEIRELGYGEELEAWDSRGAWPTSVTFLPSQEQVNREVAEVLSGCCSTSELSIVVTSNGRLRSFGRLVADGKENHTGFKMMTGASSVMQFRDGHWEILGWNLPPDQVQHLLQSAL
jgi:broad specificity phosphatase PhoE